MIKKKRYLQKKKTQLTAPSQVGYWLFSNKGEQMVQWAFRERRKERKNNFPIWNMRGFIYASEIDYKSLKNLNFPCQFFLLFISCFAHCFISLEICTIAFLTLEYFVYFHSFPKHWNELNIYLFSRAIIFVIIIVTIIVILIIRPGVLAGLLRSWLPDQFPPQIWYESWSK